MAVAAQPERRYWFQEEVLEMNGDLISLLSPLTEKGVRLGADEVEIFAERRIEKSINIEATSLKSATGSMTEGVGIRVLRKRALGFASLNSLQDEKIVNALEKAVSIAKCTPPVDHYTFASPQSLSPIKGVYDKALANLTMEDILEYADILINATRNFDERISIDMSTLQAISHERAIVTSKGISATDTKSLLQWFLYGMAVDGDDIGSFDGVLGSVVKKTDIDFEATAKEFGVKVIRNLGATKAEGLDGPAIISPDALTDLLRVLISSASANQIQDGSSCLADRLGEEVATPNLSLIDDGTKANEVGSESFDREGVPHKLHSVIEKGIFKGIFYDVFTANKDGFSSTGHGSGSFRQVPVISYTNIEVKEGSTTLDNMVSDIKRGLLIPRISSFPNTVSGDFAGPIKGAQLIENGEIIRTLKEIQVTGNVFELLKNITSISKERDAIRFEGKTNLVPSVCVDGLKFSV